MKKILFCLLMLLIVGCVPAQQRLSAVAREESARMLPPREHLSAFSSFELQPMTRSESVRSDHLKTPATDLLEQKLRAELLPLLACWEKNQKTVGRKLLIQPSLFSLYIVGGGARFFIGGMAGDSRIVLDLKLVEEGTGDVIALSRINMSVSGASGSWSIGATDQNLLDYVVATSKQYLLDNYENQTTTSKQYLMNNCEKRVEVVSSGMPPSFPIERKQGSEQLKSTIGVSLDNKTETQEDSIRRQIGSEISKNTLDRLHGLKDILIGYDKCVEKTGGYSLEDCVGNFSTKIIREVPYARAQRVKKIKDKFCDKEEFNMSDIFSCIEEKVAAMNGEVHDMSKCINQITNNSTQLDEECLDLL